MFLSEMLATQSRVSWLDGVVVETEAGFIRFDPLKKSVCGGSYTFISHAHSDHCRAIKTDRKGYLTTETKDILSKGNYKKELDQYIPIRYNDTVTIDNLDIDVHNSGHILGSSQYVIRDSTSTIVYTGDINCREMLTTNAAKVIPCDTLILETTYGNPTYLFPSLTDIYVNIINWAINEIQKGVIPTFVAYSIGKAQELVKAFNEFTKIPVVTSNRIAKVNEVYIKNGIKLNYVNAESEDGKELLNQQCVQIVSPSERKYVAGCCTFATTTGWALRFGIRSFDAAFPLSCHADFRQLLKYVEYAKPREVFTVHGFKKDFAKYISKKLGIHAREIPPMKQSSLRAFM